MKKITDKYICLILDRINHQFKSYVIKIYLMDREDNDVEKHLIFFGQDFLCFVVKLNRYFHCEQSLFLFMYHYCKYGKITRRFFESLSNNRLVAIARWPLFKVEVQWRWIGHAWRWFYAWHNKYGFSSNQIQVASSLTNATEHRIRFVEFPAISCLLFAWDSSSRFFHFIITEEYAIDPYPTITWIFDYRAVYTFFNKRNKRTIFVFFLFSFYINIKF